MSEQTIDNIRKAVQEHIDSFEGPAEQLVDFIVCHADLRDDGVWTYAYVTSGMVSPHGTIGLLNQTKKMVLDDVAPER